MAHAEAQPTLTPAEAACLFRHGQGLSYKEIAQALQCSESTVSTHLKAVRRKLGSSNTRAAARRYFGLDILPKSLGGEDLGSDAPLPVAAPDLQQPSAAEPVAGFVSPPLQPTSLVQEQDDADDLTPLQKTVRIAAIAIGAAVAAGATLPGTLLLLHALQTLHGSR